MTKWIPKFIRKSLEYKSQDVVTSAEYNAILNMLITQGDYNASWLEWLTNEGFEEFFKDLNGDDLKKLIAESASEQLETLVASSANKTCAHLNNPMFTFLDESATTSTMQVFKSILDAHGIVGSISCYSSLVGVGTPHMEESDLRAMQVNGYSIVNHGTDKSDITDESVDSVISNSTAFMSALGISNGSNIFVYNNSEQPSQTVCTKIDEQFSVAIGRYVGVNDTDLYDTSWLRIIPLSSGLEVVQSAISEAMRRNLWCIFTCDTSSATFESEVAATLETAITTIKENTDAVITTLPTAVNVSAHTINNKLKDLQTQIDLLTTQVYSIQTLLKGFRKITHGSVDEGLPETGNEGDIHIMYE